MLPLGFAVAGFAFASWTEAAFVLAQLVPLAFFVFCTLALWRLLLAAIPARHRLARLAPPAVSADAVTREWEMGSAPTRFAILIPAHDEEMLIGSVVEGLSRLDYPPESYRVVVIADNCADDTAEIARRHGALVLERSDTVRIGKGYALEWALQVLQNESRLAFDAVVILDADTFVSPNLLREFAAALAAGQTVAQARYEVLNTDESWRTRLMACALALAHLVKPLGREQLKLSDGLKGNGMCFARSVVEDVPWSGASITEDIEYTLRLCRAGRRVAFLPSAAVWAQMPTTSAQAVGQRKRWEGGRYRLLVTVAPRLLWEGIRTRSRILRDRALELVIPPFAELFAVPAVMFLGNLAAAALWGWHGAAVLAWAWGVVLGLQAGYLAGGLWTARVPAATALVVLRAPVYIVWKFGVYVLMAAGRSAGGWKRTERRQL